ncbi:DNA repair and recombination protein, putative [Entamoeba histolytica HM-1:IMSS-B]|uniref:ATP-dependent DNA helicase n=4 Tax=Entamoeba histolytica TaxID=5759 RepID=C4M921_ENTH1|nr:DNA repair and recombination protein, putative [Entamoeba histolytica HM-1:IMSS]EAL43809.1 DNA repair and recombination protein, putative [Entamoeba histolytica HM-1:IMSS]EMH72892.1 DNA repair and recombination protein, putative [Entamoeba histolytica HM-1:IMSS-B]ENY63320.1 DNA repair and recombination protein, putative [Entamoeba histolytica HM-1:IMSS-A]GAT98133.1 DNA repair and recombination protein putative [Entamoeba histolytica]|eukprot:XP_649195.1 DNA repair and recombination protein, putative [Entamoeba histolytica HM-1:IMSS]
MSITPKLPRPTQSDVEMQIHKKYPKSIHNLTTTKTDKINTSNKPTTISNIPIHSIPSKAERTLSKQFSPKPTIESRNYSEKQKPKHQILQLLSMEQKKSKQKQKPIEFKQEIVKFPPLNPIKKVEKSDYSKTAAFVNDIMKFKGLISDLSDDQKEVIELAENEISFFFSGAAGTGKSYVMKKLITILKELHPEQGSVAITASTGIAACNIGGTTLHSFAGIGLGDQSVDILYTKVIKNRTAFEKWRKVEVLLIDEISMISGDLLDKLNVIAQKIKRNNLPFGGIQVIFSGDFFQLPPVSKGKEVKFVFESKCWKEVIKKCVILHTQHRQSDLTFIEMLNNIRYGFVTKKTYEILQECQKRDLGDKKKTCLFSHRLDAENYNKRELLKLTSQPYIYNSCDVGLERNRGPLKECPAPEQLPLKLGALVMLLKNTQPEIGLVNGAVGKILRFEEVKVKHKENREQKDSYAADCNIKKGENEFYLNNKLFPVVDFGKGVIVTITPDIWEIESSGLIVSARIQLPLTHAWGLSIHKSQGLTLPAAELNLEKVFEAGQAYVALSRLQSLEGLKIVGKIPGAAAWKVNKKVLEFYKEIDNQFQEIEPSELYFNQNNTEKSEATTTSSTSMITNRGVTVIKINPTLLKKYSK